MAELQIIPDHDSRTSSGGSADSNYGSSTTIYMRYGSTSYRRIGWFKWSDSLIQSYASKIKSINSAKFYLYVNSVDGGWSTGTVYRAGSDWDESKITWNNQPGITGSNLGPFNLSSVGWHNLDITTLFKNWFEQTENVYGVRVWDSSEKDDGCTVNSSENASNQPYILLDYEPKGGGFQLWWGFCESWQRRNKLWRNNKLILPKDLGFSY